MSESGRVESGPAALARVSRHWRDVLRSLWPARLRREKRANRRAGGRSIRLDRRAASPKSGSVAEAKAGQRRHGENT